MKFVFLIFFFFKRGGCLCVVSNFDHSKIKRELRGELGGVIQIELGKKGGGNIHIERLGSFKRRSS